MKDFSKELKELETVTEAMKNESANGGGRLATLTLTIMKIGKSLFNPTIFRESFLTGSKENDDISAVIGLYIHKYIERTGNDMFDGEFCFAFADSALILSVSGGEPIKNPLIVVSKHLKKDLEFVPNIIDRQEKDGTYNLDGIFIKGDIYDIYSKGSSDPTVFAEFLFKIVKSLAEYYIYDYLGDVGVASCLILSTRQIPNFDREDIMRLYDYPVYGKYIEAFDKSGEDTNNFYNASSSKSKSKHIDNDDKKILMDTFRSISRVSFYMYSGTDSKLIPNYDEAKKCISRTNHLSKDKFISDTSEFINSNTESVHIGTMAVNDFVYYITLSSLYAHNCIIDGFMGDEDVSLIVLSGSHDDEHYKNASNIKYILKCIIDQIWDGFLEDNSRAYTSTLISITKGILQYDDLTVSDYVKLFDGKYKDDIKDYLDFYDEASNIMNTY